MTDNSKVRKTIIVGDIHGMYKMAVRLLEKADFSPEADRIVFLGDIMDRGPESYQVFMWIKQLKLQMGDRCKFIRGNHEQMLLDCNNGYKNVNLWLNHNGGYATRRSFRNNNDDVMDYMDWIDRNTEFYYISDSPKFQCVHAGIVNDIEHTSKAILHEVCLWDQSMVFENKYRGSLTVAGHNVVKKPLYLDGSGKERGLRLPYRESLALPERGMILIDTGAVYGYSLTAMVIQGNGFFTLIEEKYKFSKK